MDNPDVESISYDRGQIVIKLESVNLASKEHVLENIKLKKSKITGNKRIKFDIISDPSITWEQNTYNLFDFNPSLEKGKTYFLIFQDGAFNNEGTGIGDQKIKSGMSDAGVYKLVI
jgi:hypothetical protein